MSIAINNISGIVEDGGSFTADQTGTNNLLLAISIEADNDELQTISSHTHGGVAFTNEQFSETVVGSNAIYSHAGWIDDSSIVSGSQTYASKLSLSPPSIGHSSFLMTLQGAHQTAPVVFNENFAQSGVSVFPTHTFSATTGQLVVYIVQANKSGSITPPADIGADSWVEQLEPWFVGGAFVDGAVYTMIATEDHTSVTAVAGETISSFICSSHLYVIDQAAVGGATTTPVSSTNSATGTTTEAASSTFLRSQTISGTGTNSIAKTIRKAIANVGTGVEALIKTVKKTTTIATTGTASSSSGVLNTESHSTSVLGSLTSSSVYIEYIAPTISLTVNLARSLTRAVTRTLFK